MQFEVEELKKIVGLNNSILSNNNLRKDGPLSNLIFIIRDNHLYTLTQGSKNMTTLALLVSVSDYEAEDAVYAINANRFQRTLNECKDSVDLVFNKTDDTQDVELHTEFGVIKFNTYLVENTSNDTRFDEILPTLLEQKQATVDEGHQLDKSVWEQNLKIVGAVREEEFVQNPFMIDTDVVGILLPYMILRYKSELPYSVATELDVVRVLREAVSLGEDETYSQVTEDNRRSQLHFNSGGVYLLVNGVSTQTSRINQQTWEQDVEFTGEVDLAQLKQLIRVADIFTEDNDTIHIEWDFEQNKANVRNAGVNVNNQSGANTSLDFQNNSTTQTTVTTGINGPSLLKLLTYTDDETVSVEVLPQKRNLHITFTEGDLYVHCSLIQS